VQVVQAGHRVVRDGPYGVIRHPGYAGSILALLGLGLATANVATLATFVGVSLYVFLRTIRMEEATLERELGAEYVAYSQTTPRLIPRSW